MNIRVPKERRDHYRRHFRLGTVVAGMIAPIMLRSNKKRVKAARLILTLVGGLALKWSLTHAGRESAVDIHANA